MARLRRPEEAPAAPDAVEPAGQDAQEPTDDGPVEAQERPDALGRPVDLQHASDADEVPGPVQRGEQKRRAEIVEGEVLPAAPVVADGAPSKLAEAQLVSGDPLLRGPASGAAVDLPPTSRRDSSAPRPGRPVPPPPPPTVSRHDPVGDASGRRGGPGIGDPRHHVLGLGAGVTAGTVTSDPPARRAARGAHATGAEPAVPPARPIEQPVATLRPTTVAPVPRLAGRRPRVRRVTRVVRHIDPWSVFKVAAAFSIVAYTIALVAGVLLWNVAYATGTIDNIERGMESTGWEVFELDGGEIFHNAWIGGLFLAVGLTGLAVLVATLFNLITDLVGGVRLTVLEEEVVERTASPMRRFAMSPGARQDASTAGAGGADARVRRARGG